MKRAIITGADGFIGSYVVEELLKREIEVIAIDLIKQPRRLQDKKGLTYIAVDLSNQEELKSKIQGISCDTWFHFAWSGIEREKRRGYELSIRNAYLTVECMKIAKNIGARRFIGVGSVCEKEVVESIFQQTIKMDMTSYYGIGKLVAHGLCKAVSEEIGIEYVCGVISNTYGVGSSPNQLIYKVIQELLDGKKIKCTEGKQYYDFVYVTDVAEAFYLIGEKGKAGYEYVIGSGYARSLKEFLGEIAEYIGEKGEILFGAVPFQGAILSPQVFDISQLQKDTGFSPRVSFQEGIKRMHQWIQIQ